jgi:hypothetical protein
MSKKNGLDQDLVSCMEHHPQPFERNDIERVLALVEGPRNKGDWYWIIQLHHASPKKQIVGEFIVLRAHCPETGWGDASKVYFKPAPSAKLALKIIDNMGGSGVGDVIYRQIKRGKVLYGLDVKDPKASRTEPGIESLEA